MRLLLRIGELQAAKIGDGEKAFDAYSRCFRRIRRTRPRARSSSGWRRSTRRGRSWSALYEAAIEKLEPDKRRRRRSCASCCCKVADAYDEKLEKPEKAIEYFRRAQAIEPDDLAALEALERLYTRNEKWPELLEVYRKKVELTHEPDAREQIYFRMAYLWEEMLQNVDEAIATYKEVLAQDSANLKALKALDRLYLGEQAVARAGRQPARGSCSSPTSKPRRSRCWCGSRRCARSELGEVAAAVDTYRQVLELERDNEAASTALERLVQLRSTSCRSRPSSSRSTRRATTGRSWSTSYEILVRHSMDPARKIELLHQIGELYEVAGEDGDKAFATYDRALREEPGLKETQQRLERLARSSIAGRTWSSSTRRSPSR